MKSNSHREEFYTGCYQRLKEKKLSQTREKVEKYGFMDEDDYGTIVPPDNFIWNPIPNHPDGSFYGFTGWGDNFKDLMEKLPPYVNPDSALAGVEYFFMERKRPTNWHPEYSYCELLPNIEKYNIISGIGAMHHMCGDVHMGLNLGWKGLLDKVRCFKGKHEDEKKEFYDAEEKVIFGIQTWIRNTVTYTEKLIDTGENNDILNNLKEMKAVNEWIVDNPPRTLREACQWLAWYNMAGRTYNRDGAGGQLDEILRPYYEADLKNGIIDDEDAIYYIACLLLADPHYYQLGGPDVSGRDMTSRVSYLVLEAADRLDISANLTIRVHDGLDRDFYLKSIEYLFKNRNGWPRYSGDKSLVEGFSKNGYSVELARQRIAVGCHWMSIPGKEYTINDCIKINTAKVFEVAFNEMIEDTVNSPSTKKLLSLFEKHLRIAVDTTANCIDFHLKYQKYNAPELILNLFCEGSVENGLDVSDGCLPYYNIGVDGAGIAVVADSFAALEQRIEKEKRIKWDQIAKYIKSNYKGPEGERVRLLMKHSSRYGEDYSLGDEWAVKVSKLFTGIVTEKPTPGGTKMIPGWFSWSNTISFGKAVGTTPNGRKAGEPINHGANPMPGFRKDGAVTALSNAIASVQCGYGNTVPMQLELDPGISMANGGVEKIADLMKTHFDLGGTLININIIDARKIREAHMDPGKYPDLVVRVTGFTAYFSALSPEFRQLVVDRIIEKY